MILKNNKPGIGTIWYQIDQDGTDLPVRTTIFSNVTQTITMTRAAAGQYNLLCSEPIFNTAKTLCNGTRTGQPAIYYSKAANNDYYVQAWPLSANNIALQVHRSSDFAYVDISELEMPIFLKIEMFND